MKTLTLKENKPLQNKIHTKIMNLLLIILDVTKKINQYNEKTHQDFMI